MENRYSYKLSKLTEELRMDILYKSSDFDDVLIYTGDVHRPGLQLAGFFDYYDPTRIQLVGHMETAYMEKFTAEERRVKWEALLERKMPALIMCHGAQITSELRCAAEKHDVTVLGTQEQTTAVMSEIIRTVRRALAPRTTSHGVLVEVYGVGILLLGESGVGKSETAIELLKRGHRLIADDAVEMKAINANEIQGTAPDLIRHYVELRGIGVIDVRQIFGVGAVKLYQNISLVVNLEPWQENANYDRLGINDDTVNILGVEIPTLTIPVRPGRNLAVIIEVAAINQRQKIMGYNAAVEFTNQLEKHLAEQNEANGDD